MNPYKRIPLSKLIINPDNDRFEPVNNEQEAIDIMLSELGPTIYELAKDILEKHLSKTPLYVIPNEDKYIIKDGNRRVTAIKLMTHPNLIDKKKFPDYKRQFTQLNRKFKKNPIKFIYCVLYDNAEDADIWVKLQHTGMQNGRGVVSWNSEQIRRFDIKHGKKDFMIQIYDYIKNNANIDTDTKQLLSQVKMTNLERLLSDKNVKKNIGLILDKGIIKSCVPEEILAKTFTRIIKDFSASNFKVRDIYNNEDRTKYINSISSDLPEESDKDINKIWQISNENYDEQDADIKSNHEKKINKINSTERKRLIPSTCSINIINPRVNSIYNELKKLDVKKFPNSVAVLLRVFVELSCDCFLDGHPNLIAMKKESGVTVQCSGMDLNQKIDKINQYLNSKHLIDKSICKGIKTLKKEDNLGSIDSLNNYVHSTRFTPIPESLPLIWNNIQEFIVILWNNINDKDTEK